MNRVRYETSEEESLSELLDVLALEASDALVSEASEEELLSSELAAESVESAVFSAFN